MPSVLFVAYGGGHVAALVPVYEALLRRGTPAVFLALTTAAAYLEQRGLPCIGFKDHPHARDPEVQQWGERLWQQQIEAGAIDPARPTVSQAESMAYLGLNYRDLVRQFGEADAAARFARLDRQCFEPRQALQELLEAGAYAAVVTTSAPRAEKAAIHAASALQIPSLCLVDLFAFQEVRWLRDPGYASRLCVLNQQVRQLLIEAGRPAEAITITGNPAFDSLNASRHHESAQQLRKAWGLSPQTQVILWASQVEPLLHPITAAPGDPSLPARVEEALRHLVWQTDERLLVVRPHPSETDARQQQQGVKVCGRDTPLEPLLQLADVVVTLTSTVGLQATLLGKPVVAVRLSVFEEESPLRLLPQVTGVDDMSAVVTAVTTVLASAGEESGQSPDAQRNAGASAAEAVTAVLDQLLEPC